VEFEEQPAPRLVDRQTGNALPLSETESQLIKAWDGSTSATRLSAAVFVHGLDVEPWQIEQFFERLERAGLLANAKPQIPNFVAAQPGVETPDDVVPALRGDLVISRPEGAKGTMQVKDPLTERLFTLYDFEVSIARMLDGKRTAGEVIAAAGKLGIPVTLQTLKAFLSQLKAYRFIDDRVKGGDTTWSKREAWTEEVRQLYQGALRMMRAGKFPEALSYAEAMAEAAPHLSEVRELKQRIETEAAGAFDLRTDFETLHTPPNATPAVKPPRDETGPFASFGFHSQPPSAAELPPIPEELQPPPRRTLMDRLKDHKKAAAGTGLGLVVVLVLLHPVQQTQTVACELQLETLGTPKTLRGGKVDDVVVRLGSKVEKGAVLARLGTGESLDALDAKIAEVQKQLDATPAPPTGRKVDAARAALKKAQAAADQADKARQKAPRSKQAALEKKWKAKVKAVDAAKVALEKLTHQSVAEGLKTKLDELRTRRVGLAAELEKNIVIAPVSGVFISVGPLPEELKPNDGWGLVVAENFKLVSKDKLLENVLDATFRAAGRDVEVKLVDGAPVIPVAAPLVGAKGTLELKAGSRPWIATVFD